MITELVLIGAAYGTFKFMKITGFKYKRDFRELVEKAGLYNKKEQTLKVHKVTQLEYGYKMRVGVPYGIGYEDIEKMEDTFKTNLGATEVEFERDERHSMIDITVITKPLNDLKYEPLETDEHEIYVGYNYKEVIKVDLNSFPHLLIGGESGSGKSRLLLLILTNLINQHSDIDLYLIQIRKSDVSVFKKCKQVKYYAKSLEDTRDVLRHIENLCIEREKVIDELILEGIYNIADYNKRFKKSKFNYVYVVLDEFSFFNPNGADDKETKEVKKEILGHIKNLVMVGRSLGIFIFTSLQKPSQSSIPADIKSQLTSRISFKQLDSSTSILILGNGDATKLKKREAFVRTIQQDKIRVPFIDHDLIMEHIQDRIEENHQYITLNTVIPELPNSEAIKEDNAVIEEVLKDVDWSGFGDS
jgi:DNA segregation ATPase FtsK/SpoIIIE, S-DNA-T family